MNVYRIAKTAINFLNLRKNESISAEKMRTIQEKKFRELIKYAYEHSDFYKAKFENAGIDINNIKSIPITDFPVTDKKEITENYESVLTIKDKFSQKDLQEFDSLKSGGLFREKYHVVHSSGSTGTPRYFVYDDSSWSYIVAAIIRALFWDMSFGKVISMFSKNGRGLYIATTVGRFGGASIVKALTRIGGTDIRFLDINQPYNEWKTLASEFCPKMIAGYPTSIKLFAQIVEENNYPVKTERIISTGEPLSDSSRKYLSKVFKCPVIDLYSCSESLCIGLNDSSCNEQGYIFDDVNYIECVNGEMYLTTLYNYTQPLIRYRITDRIELFDALEKPFKKFKVFSGREDDIFWVKDDNGNIEYLHPLTMEDFCEDGLIDYQIIQKDRKTFLILAQVEKDEERIVNGIEESVNEILRQHKLDFVTFNVELVDKIKVDPLTGKKHLAVPLEYEEVIKA